MIHLSCRIYGDSVPFVELDGLLSCSQEPSDLSTFWVSLIESAPLYSYFFEISFNIKFPSRPRSSQWWFPFRFFCSNVGYLSVFPMHATCPCHLTFFYFTTPMLSKLYKFGSSSLFYLSILLLYVSFRSKFSPDHILSLYSICVRDPVSVS
jgi:hypothetical protein